MQRNFMSKDTNKAEGLSASSMEKARAEAPLTTTEWLHFFIFPFFTPTPRGVPDDFTESERERFKRYGFKRKLRQAAIVKTLGIVFWMGISVALVIWLRSNGFLQNQS